MGEMGNRETKNDSVDNVIFVRLSHITITNLLVHANDNVNTDQTAKCVYRIARENCHKVYKVVNVIGSANVEVNAIN